MIEEYSLCNSAAVYDSKTLLQRCKRVHGALRLVRVWGGLVNSRASKLTPSPRPINTLADRTRGENACGSATTRALVSYRAASK